MSALASYRFVVFLLGVLLAACGSEPAMPARSGWLPVHDDLAFSLTKHSKISEEAPVDRYEIRQVEEPIERGLVLKVRLVTKVLDETERATIERSPDAIAEIWPNSLELRRSDLVSHVTDRAWQAVDYDPSGLAHEDFEGGHSTYRTPAKVTLSVAFVYKLTLVVVNAIVEFDESAPSKSEQERSDEWTPTLERAVKRLQRRS